MIHAYVKIHIADENGLGLTNCSSPQFVAFSMNLLDEKGQKPRNGRCMRTAVTVQASTHNICFKDEMITQ